jgi:hypothetical protein
MAKHGNRMWLVAGLGAGVMLLTCCCLGGIVGGYFLLQGPAPDKVLTGTLPLEDRNNWGWWDAKMQVWDDALPATAARYKGYRMALKANTIYVMELLPKNGDAQPFLLLQDADKVIVAKSRANAGAPTKVAYIPPKDGEHRIVAATTQGLGEFALKIHDFDKKLSGSLPIQEEDIWTTSDPTGQALRWDASTYFKAYKVPLKAGTRYQITLKHHAADARTRVVLQHPDGKTLAQSSDGGAPSASFIAMPGQSGDHRIIAAASHGLGAFTLKIEEYKVPKVALPDNKDKMPPPVATDRGKVLTLPATEMTTWSKQDPIHPILLSPYKTYTVMLKAGKAYTIDLVTRQKGQDPFLILTDPFGVLLASDDDSGGFPNARIVYTPLKDGEYRILATTLDHGLGPYTLSVREGP